MTTYTSRETSSGTPAAAPTLELDLMDDDRRYGWISGDRVGFIGFGDHVAAVQAAWVAHRTSMQRAARAHGTAPVSDAPVTFALAPHGEDEAILANDERIAVLVRPAIDSPTDPESFGFEIRIPLPADEISVRATAYRIYRALKSSGVAWSLRRTSVASAAQKQEGQAAIGDHSAAAAGDDTTTEDVGRSDDSDHSRQRARRFLPPRWRRRRRASTKERVERRIGRLRDDHAERWTDERSR